MGAQFKNTTTHITVPRLTASQARTYALLFGQPLPVFVERVFNEWFEKHPIDQAMEEAKKRILAETDSGA